MRMRLCGSLYLLTVAFNVAILLLLLEGLKEITFIDNFDESRLCERTIDILLFYFLCSHPSKYKALQ